MRDLPPPVLPPRALAALLGIACLISLAGAATLAVDCLLGLRTGTFHLVRNPVTRDDGGVFTAVAVMEILGIALCLGAAWLEFRLAARCRRLRRP